MKLGYIFGLLWGVILGGVFLALLSLISEVPGQKPPQAALSTPPIETRTGEDSGQTLDVIEDELPNVSATADSRRPDEGQEQPQTAVLSAEVTSSGTRPTAVIEASPFEGLVPPSLDDDITGLVALEEPVTIAQPQPQAANADEPGQANRSPGTPSLNPLLVYSVPTRVDPEKSVLSIVILDQPGAGLGPVDVAALGMVVTVAIDPRQPDAAGRMRAYRDAGFEVIAAPSLPIRAVAADINAGIADGFAVVSEAVAMLDTTGTGFEGDRRIIDAVNAALKASKHGLLTFDEGLGVAAQTAQLANVPVAVVDWDLDPKDQSATVVRRFMDQAAADAKRNGSAVVMGRLREETMLALTQWSEGRRAKALNIVPLSTILLQ